MVHICNSALQRLRQEDCCKFEAIPCYIANTTPTPPKKYKEKNGTSWMSFLLSTFLFLNPVLKVYTKISPITHNTAYKKVVGWAKLRQGSERCNTGIRVDQLMLVTKSWEVRNQVSGDAPRYCCQASFPLKVSNV